MLKVFRLLERGHYAIRCESTSFYVVHVSFTLARLHGYSYIELDIIMFLIKTSVKKKKNVRGRERDEEGKKSILYAGCRELFEKTRITSVQYDVYHSY